MYRDSDKGDKFFSSLKLKSSISPSVGVSPVLPRPGAARAEGGSNSVVWRWHQAERPGQVSRAQILETRESEPR